MVRPARFGFNAQTAASNAFQRDSALDVEAVQQSALYEFDAFVASLRQRGITVSVLHDTPHPPKPDAVFPNNWFSCSPNGPMILYPMLTPNRREERSPEAVRELLGVSGRRVVVDLTQWEQAGAFLEGTGSVVFDHLHRRAFACLSPRTSREAMQRLCQMIHYEAVCFTASDAANTPIYHTNVMMGIGTKWAVVCAESIGDVEERALVLHALCDRELILISRDQMAAFSGNVMEVRNAAGETFCLLSGSAFRAFSVEQLQQLSAHAQPLVMEIPTIETVGGGSARCMVGEVFE
jgi:hypothetical protein